MKTLVGLEREAYGLIEAQKIEMTTKVDNQRKPQDMTDDELVAIIAGGGAGAVNTA
jgi:hypothetical protein